jgi:GTP cyclohydrolase II
MTDKHCVTVRNAVPLPMESGATATLITFSGFGRHEEHFVLRFDGPASSRAPLVRVHSECITGDLFRSQRCDCGAQIQQALEELSREGGLLVYLRQEGRGIGLYAKIDAYRLQDRGLDTFAANEHLALPRDGRRFACAARMLQALGVTRIRLHSSNPDKAAQLRESGVEVVESIPTRTYLNPYNERYLRAKAEVAHHRLTVPAIDELHTS